MALENAPAIRLLSRSGVESAQRYVCLSYWLMPSPPGDLDPLVASRVRAMRARNLSPKTIRTYADSAMQLLGYLREAGAGAWPGRWCPRNPPRW